MLDGFSRMANQHVNANFPLVRDIRTTLTAILLT